MLGAIMMVFIVLSSFMLGYVMLTVIMLNVAGAHFLIKCFNFDKIN